MKTNATTLSRDEARYLADCCAQLLREQFGVRRVVLFGSAAGDAPWHSHSDTPMATTWSGDVSVNSARHCPVCWKP